MSSIDLIFHYSSILLLDGQVIVQANYEMTHHKLQQKLFLLQQSQKVS